VEIRQGICTVVAQALPIALAGSAQTGLLLMPGPYGPTCLLPWPTPCPPSPRARCQALAPLTSSLRELAVDGGGMPSDALIHAGRLTGLTHLELTGEFVFGPGGPAL
jgi:hypothetical protein